MEIDTPIAHIGQPAGRRQYWLAAALIAVCALPLVLPGDATWIFDEPRLLIQAWAANHQPGKFLGIPLPFTIASMGLPGNRGAVYGPAAVWFYQLLILLPHHMPLLVAIRAAVVTVGTAAGLIWLSRASGLSISFAVVILLSPWLWLYSRQLWDNSFAIPLAALALGSYAGALKTKSRWALVVWALTMLLMPLIHLMALAIVAPMVLHAFWFQWRLLKRHRLVLLAVTCVVATLSMPYLVQFLLSFHATDDQWNSPFRGWFFPLLGAHHLSAIGLNNIMGDGWMSRGPMPLPILARAATVVSALAYPAAWVGMLLALPRARRVLQRRKDCAVLDHLAAVALSIWICQTLLDGAERIYGLPHYYNATWIAYAFFIWMAVDALPRSGLTRAAVSLYAASLLMIVGSILLQIHTDGGTRTLQYGPTIANQVQVADIVGSYPAGSVHDNQFLQWKRFQDNGDAIAYTALHLLRPSAHIRDGLPRRVVIRYRNAFPDDSRIEVEDFPLPPPLTTQPATTSPGKE